MSEVVVTSVDSLEQPADASEADDKIISPERKAEICAGAASAACAACAVAAGAATVCAAVVAGAGEAADFARAWGGGCSARAAWVGGVLRI